jgi:hypothetical protein
LSVSEAVTKLPSTEVTVTAAERETGHTGGRNDAEGHSLSERLRRVVYVARGAARADPHGPIPRVDPNAFHCRQVDDQAVVDAAETGTVVTAATNGERELIVAAEVHCRYDVGDVGASSNGERPFVDHGVVELSRFFVFRVGATDHWAAQSLRELCNCFVVHGAILS